MLSLTLTTCGLLCLVSVAASAQIDNIELLVKALADKGPNAKVAFLTSSNYLTVKNFLPTNVQPVIVPHQEDLITCVLNGSVEASLTSGLPEKQYHDKVNFFGSTIISMQSILIAPDYGPEKPHGIMSSEFLSYDLSKAINAAVSRVQYLGIDQQLAEKNGPKEIARAHTCKDDDLTQFTVPNKKDATGLLKVVLRDRNLKVLADGPYNWGGNDGNYLVNPPTGFYPDLLQAIVDQFGKLAGPDGEVYGPVNFTRMYSTGKPFPWYKAFNGEAHMSEPYFLYDTPFLGSGKPCSSDADCPNAADLPVRKETCANGYCQGPRRARSIAFRSGCTATATESQFLTKKAPDNGGGSESDNKRYQGGLIAGIVIFAIAFGICLVLLGILIFKEKQGHPLFFK